MQVCFACAAEGAKKRCERCKLAYYCNQTYQKQDWSHHKLKCRVQERSTQVPDIEDLAIKRTMDAQGKCECKECAQLCGTVPSVYDPVHVATLIKKDPDFFDKCVQDYYVYNETPIRFEFYLRPPQVIERPGERAPFFKSGKSNCRNLTDHGCALAYEDRPLGCRSAFVCKNIYLYDKDAVSTSWTSPIGKTVMEAFEKHATSKGRDVGFTQTLKAKFSNVSIEDVMQMLDAVHGD